MTELIYIATVAVAALTLWGIGVAVWKAHTEVVTIWDYQTGLHFKHGRFLRTLEAGKHHFWGAGHHVIVYDTRIAEVVVQGQELITADSATVKLTAVAQWKIADPVKFQAGAEDANQALYTLIQLALRQVIGALELDAIIEQKAGFGDALTELVRETAATDLGVDVKRIEVRDMMLGGDLKGVYAGVITARKEAQANQERARGEAAALRTLANAARVFENNPDLFRLRYLETLKEASTSGYGNQLIIGVPEELMGLVKKD
jgi:regulator of protease activity HflC (stomatin/prohibitin superfamily)